MARNLRERGVWILALALIFGSMAFLITSPELVSVATGGGGPEAKFVAGDVVVHKLDHTRYHVLDSYPNEQGDDRVYELAPVDDPEAESTWVSGSLLAFER